MRDFAIVGIVAVLSLMALSRPWIGVMLWNWLSIMNPHKFAYTFAFDLPLAQAAAVCTFVGLLFTRQERSSPFKSSAIVVFFVFMVWMTISWLLGLDRDQDLAQWSKVMKIDLMVLVAMVVLHSKKHIIALAWVAAGSLMLLGMKGGIFTILGGGGQRVWGPSGSFIGDNNEFGLALIMTIPLLRFLQMQLQSRLGRLAMTAGMVLCAVAAIGTHSRGALLAIVAMALLLWWRAKSRVLGGAIILATAIGLFTFMPESWSERMTTIENYQADSSAQGRLAAWTNAWNLAFDYPTGVGFDAARPELFARYSHDPNVSARAAHSIYFQVLGNHGFIGLILFVAIWVITWLHAQWLRKSTAADPEAQWCADLGSMAHVSLLGYFVGGAFLSLSYFDLPYVVMTMVALSRAWVMKQAWKVEPVEPQRWWTLPGMAAAARPW